MLGICQIPSRHQLTTCLLAHSLGYSKALTFETVEFIFIYHTLPFMLANFFLTAKQQQICPCCKLCGLEEAESEPSVETSSVTRNFCRGVGVQPIHCVSACICAFKIKKNSEQPHPPLATLAMDNRQPGTFIGLCLK